MNDRPDPDPEGAAAEADRARPGSEAGYEAGPDRELTVDGLREDDELAGEVTIIARAALERNAREPVVMDLRGLSDATDFFVIATGDSDVHTRAIAESVRERMEEEGFEPVGVEGEDEGSWILMDYFNVVVHLFLPRVRDFYRLERLWGDAPKIAVRD